MALHSKLPSKLLTPLIDLRVLHGRDGAISVYGPGIQVLLQLQYNYMYQSVYSGHLRPGLRYSGNTMKKTLAQNGLGTASMLKFCM